MNSNITEEQIKFFKSILEKYEPYPLDEPKLNYIDEYEILLDRKRVMATEAKRILLENGIGVD